VIKKLDDVYAVIPVPLHSRRLRERGYNQVDTFAAVVADGLNVPLEKNLLVRSVYAKTQTRKDKAGRSENTKSVFDITFHGKIAGKHLLLVDDVLTAGATLTACGNALKKIPRVRLSVLCIAYTDS
jgi:ComF family protein